MNWLRTISIKESKTDPTLGSRFLAVIGSTVPPIEEPMAKKPMAKPRRCLNQWAITARVGPTAPPHPNYKSMDIIESNDV